MTTDSMAPPAPTWKDGLRIYGDDAIRRIVSAHAVALLALDAGVRFTQSREDMEAIRDAGLALLSERADEGNAPTEKQRLTLDTTDMHWFPQPARQRDEAFR